MSGLEPIWAWLLAASEHAPSSAESAAPIALPLLLVFVMLTDLAIIGAIRIDSCISITAAQGAALGMLPLLLEGHTIDLQLIGLAILSFALKGIVFPWLLLRSLREADIRHDVEPLLGFGASVLVALLLMAGSFFLANNMRLPHAEVIPSLVLPCALSTIAIGLLMIISRRKAITQTVGYLVMENGIFVFGVVLARNQPFLVEMGVLLDVFVAVFVMGITIFHISREFDHINVDEMSQLKD